MEVCGSIPGVGIIEVSMDIIVRVFVNEEDWGHHKLIKRDDDYWWEWVDAFLQGKSKLPILYLDKEIIYTIIKTPKTKLQFRFKDGDLEKIKWT